MDKIDTDLYSRQIGTFGMEAMGKLVQMNVLIGGMRGLGVETAKNIILAGPKSVTLWDPTIVNLSDLGTNFYLKESDIGITRRDQASLEQLTQLNPYVTVSVCNFDPFKDVAKLRDYNVVCLTEMYDTAFVAKADEQMRETSGGLIYSAAVGVSGFVFSDFGKDFQIRDHDGEECKQYIVRNVSKKEPGVVLIDDTSAGTGKLAYTDGDYVVFREIQGMSELNDSPPRPIKYISPIAFSIEDTSKYGEYTSGGIVEQVKVPKPVSYRSFADSFEVPYTSTCKVPDPTDFAKFGRNELLHVAFKAVHAYKAKNEALPEMNNMTQAKEVVDIAKEMYDSGKQKEVFYLGNAQEFDEEVVSNVARWSRCNIVPITSFLGGVVAQEIVKFTGKYTPINQWMWFDFFEAVANIKDVDRTLKCATRYDEQIAIFGNEIQQKLQDMNIFMIGAGALGCEFLKEFALMGCSTKKGLLTVTDNDHIEISNLNRQFLFRRDDVKSSKSKVAASAVKKMNADFNTKDLQSLVAQVNDHVFNDQFWGSQDFIINAVDNVNARKYIDSQCTWYNKPLIDSGTLGTKAHSQLIYPHVTNCYNDMQDPVEDSVPMCTLHNFPSMIEHCIEWGRDQFNENFNLTVSDTSKYLANAAVYINELKKEGNSTFQLTKLNAVKECLDISATGDFDKCINFAFKNFVDKFDHNIRQLLFNFPADYMNSDGSKFWTGSKRVPAPITYNANEALCFQYVATFSTLVGQALNIPTKDFDYIRKYSAALKVPVFAPKKIFIKVKDTDPDEPLGGDDESKIEVVLKELTKHAQLNKKFTAHDFEKDDDKNHHIDQIHSCSNLRARNYTIVESDRQKTKMIAGKIIPAIATTTAAITGLVAMQIYTTLQTDKLDFMRGAYINLGVNLFVLTEPGPKIETRDKDYDPIMLGPVRAIPSKWTCWDKMTVNKSMTIQELIDYFTSEYKLEASIITCKGITLIQTFQPSAKTRLGRKVEELYEELSKSKIPAITDNLILEVSCDCEDGAVALTPLLKYTFR